MAEYYILQGHTSVPVDNVIEWGRAMSDHIANRVGLTEIEGHTISTVFLGLNHAFGNGPPLLFETMVFAPGEGTSDCYCKRCSTWEQAEAQHQVACDWVRAGKP